LISIGASATGFFEDATRYDTVAAGDDCVYIIVTANSGDTGASITV
jgi:hypothetical protein